MSTAFGYYEDLIRVQDSYSYPVDRRNQLRFNPLGRGVVQDVTLAGNAFTPLIVPVGTSVAFVFFRAAGAVNLTLKGITTDAGVPLLPAASPGPWDLRIPLATTQLGFLNNGPTQVVEILYL
jgi:hypothetical protein